MQSLKRQIPAVAFETLTYRIAEHLVDGIVDQGFGIQRPVLVRRKRAGRGKSADRIKCSLGGEDIQENAVRILDFLQRP